MRDINIRPEFSALWLAFLDESDLVSMWGGGQNSIDGDNLRSRITATRSLNISLCVISAHIYRERGFCFTAKASARASQNSVKLRLGFSAPYEFADTIALSVIFTCQVL